MANESEKNPPARIAHVTWLYIVCALYFRLSRLLSSSSRAIQVYVESLPFTTGPNRATVSIRDAYALKMNIKDRQEREVGCGAIICVCGRQT